VSFTPRPLYSQGESPWYALDRRLGVRQSRSGRGGEEKNSQPRQESNPRTPIVQPVAQRYTDWATTALKFTCTCIEKKVYVTWALQGPLAYYVTDFIKRYGDRELKDASETESIG
jgi:hypothetical protein